MQPVQEPLKEQYRAVWRLLPTPFRLGALLLVLGTLAGAVLEVLGLSSLAALISALTPGATAGSSGFAAVATLFGAVPGQAASGRLIALCALVFTVKNAFLAGAAWLDATFAFRLHAFLSGLALRTTLRADYAEVTRRTPEQQLNLQTGDLMALVITVALPTLTVLSEVMLTLAIVGFLFWVEPALTGVVVLLVGGVAALLMWFSRHAVAGHGRRRQQMEDERVRRLREIFDHLREVYVYRAAAQSTRLVQRATDQLAHEYRAYQMLATGPRFVLELVLVGVLLVAVLLGEQDRSGTLIVSVGVFAASGFRLLLGANRLVMSAQSIRFGQPALARVLSALPAGAEEAHGAEAVAAPAPVPARKLALREVEFRYPDAHAPVLRRVNIELQRGTMVGVRGGSGGGKTTLLEVMAGLRPPGAGAVLLDDRPLRSPGNDLYRQVGYVGQTAAVFTDTVRRNVAYGHEDALIDDARVWKALEKAHLADFVRSLPGGLDSELGASRLNLSGGQAQRLALARALYSQCGFLLLDEPSSALDPATEVQIVATLSELSGECGILVVSHRHRPLEACDVVYELRHGQLARIALDDAANAAR